jgi:7,8-dihydropterin-6-yl-methyl-4-(beta-D-ribofuranosyl)aminobenzene 5'-phosphate synthase
MQMNRSVRVRVLVENRAVSDQYGCEHGLSLWVEAFGKRILFDVGQSDLCLKNASILGVDIASADHIVLSHGHHDHSGGIISPSMR